MLKRSHRSRALGLALSVAIAAAALVGGVSAASASTTKSLTVGFVVDPSWAQIPVAEQAGYFKAQGLNVKIIDFSTGPQALQALEAGQIDVTTAADVPVSAALAGSSSLRIIADGSRWKGSVIVANAKAGIKSVKSLAGKSIGTPLGTSAAYFAATFLKDAHIKAQLVNVDPSAMKSAMQQGNVGAVSVFQPYQQQVISALGKNAVVLNPSAGAYVQQSLYLASTAAVQGKAAALSAFEAALAKADAALTQRSAAAVSAVSSATQLPSALVRKILSQFDYSIELPSNLTGQLAALGRWAKTVGNLSKSVSLPSYSKFVVRSFLPKS